MSTFGYTFKTMPRPNNNNPVSVRLGELKPILQREAMAKDRSLNYIIKQVLKEHCTPRIKKK